MYLSFFHAFGLCLKAEMFNFWPSGYFIIPSVDFIQSSLLKRNPFISIIRMSNSSLQNQSPHFVAGPDLNCLQKFSAD